MVKLLRKCLPYENESLLSFIYRLAKDNDCLPKWLLKEYKLDKAYMDNSINFMDYTENNYLDFCKISINSYSISNNTFNINLKRKKPYYRNSNK
ncbi:hypothetical protein [Lutispora saccharofermentans]|uniref:Uncharacterized protein n=1 Tax=Lutispora saccharofermentans TaxID=3024236 RepID=A0ABT1NIH7_9FIRM|nr:hypothetical protein [Lutispora saccharofermentans]MCQ1531087.1 hypothetical protein [Lutispora saccharofermentans]